MKFVVTYPSRISSGHRNSSPKSGNAVVLIESNSQESALSWARLVDNQAIVVPAMPPDLKMFPVVEMFNKRSL